MTKEIFIIIKDAAIIILIATTFDRIRKGGADRWFRVVFLAILFTL